MYQLSFYVPESHLEEVKNAIFAAGGGKLGNYAACCWQCPGQGQFMALTGSDPFIGEQNKLIKIEEYKVELICHADVIKDCINALKQTHPYEEVAYAVTKIEKF